MVHLVTDTGIGHESPPIIAIPGLLPLNGYNLISNSKLEQKFWRNDCRIRSRPARIPQKQCDQTIYKVLPAKALRI